MRHRLRRAICVIAGLGSWTAAAAYDFEWNDLRVNLDSELSFGGALRAEERRAEATGIANGGEADSTNGDDGNLAFEKGDVVTAASQLTSGLTLAVGNFGIYTRGRYLVDPVLRDEVLFDTADYLPNLDKEFGLAELDRKQTQVRDQVGETTELQDAFTFGRFQLAGHGIGFKVGRQALKWGESLRFDHGLGALQAQDLNRRHVPGQALEESARPAGMGWLSLGLTRKLTVEGFYQYEWRRTVQEAAGTFWSTSDLVGAGATQLNLGFGRLGENQATPLRFDDAALPGLNCLEDTLLILLPVPCPSLGSTIPRTADVVPDGGREYGFKAQMPIAALNGLDIAVQTARYHSRLPVLSGTTLTTLASPADTASYFVEYPEDIRLYGLSFNGGLGFVDAAIQGEYTYKDGQPLQADDIELLLALLGKPSQLNPAGAVGNRYVAGWRRHQVSEWALGLSHAFGPAFGYDLLVVEVEAAGTYVHDLPALDVLRYEGPATYAPGDALVATTEGVAPQNGGYPTASSWGYRVQARPAWYNLVGPFSLELKLRFDQDLDGITPAPLSEFVEGRRQGSAIMGLSYHDAWTLDLGYTDYFGGGAQNLLADRDYYEASLRSWF